MVEFGEQLRKAREAKGITQQTLADALYVTRQTVSRWESGNRFPDILTTKKIAEILDISVGELVAAEKPKIIVERNPVIENPLVNGFTIALYAGIVISYLISVIGALMRLPSIISISPSDVWIVGAQAICQLVGIAIFAAGLVCTVKGSLSPKKTGLIVCVFLLICFFNDISKLVAVGTEHIAPIVLISIPSVIGAVMAYLFYFKDKSAAYCRAILYAASTWGIIRAVYTLGTTLVFASKYISTETALSTILSICIYTLFIYQIHVLNRKRCLADHMLQDNLNPDVQA